MADDSFILVSTKDGKSKKLAQVLTNESCRKILDFLGSNEDSTESEIAKKLDLPISTVHYNLKQLVDAGFLISDEYHYSDKGKEVSHYKLANKFIVIAPKSTFGIKQKLRSILPVGLIAGGVALILKYFPFVQKNELMKAAPMLAMDSAESGGEMLVREAVMDSAPTANDAITPVAQEVWKAHSYSQYSDIALWFFLGALLALALVLLFDWLKYRKK